MISEAKRKEILEALGYTYDHNGIMKFQQDWMYRRDWDGQWEPNTENTALTVYYTKTLTKNFKPEEFRCECGGRYCCGYPDYMKPEELAHIQTIRDHYGKPITVTCGLRCKTYNAKLKGSVANSGHLRGFAIDFYQPGVTDTLANRKKSIEYIRKLPNHKFSYGKDMKGTDGIYRSASYMGNAMHTETQAGNVEPGKTPSPTSEKPSKLVVDGIAGNGTISAAQKALGCKVVDGYIDGQRKDLKKYYPSITAVRYGRGGSAFVKALQAWAGTNPDGVWGQGTSKALQKKLKELGYYYGSIDGIAGPETVKALQRYLNGEEPQKPYKGQVMDVSEFQDAIDWSAVKAAGVEGVIVRCGYRGAEKGTLNEDAMYLNHIQAAAKAGLKVGIYMVTEGINAAEGAAEADYAVQLAQKAGIPLSYPIAVDTETVYYKKKGKKYDGRANKLSKAKRTEVIKAFCERIKALGFEPMIYASTSWLNNKLDMSKLPYKVWCAQYASKCEYKGEYVMWQYTSEASVNGVKDNVDMSKVTK